MTIEEAIKRVVDAGDGVEFHDKNHPYAVSIRLFSEGAPANITFYESYESFLKNTYRKKGTTLWPDYITFDWLT